MIGECRQYLAAHLKAAGIERVYTRPEDGTKHQAVPYAVVEMSDQSLEYDGSLVARADGPEADERTFRRRTHRRTVKAQVRIVHRDQTQLETVIMSFLAGLDRRLLDAQENAILISARGGEPEEDASLLREQQTAYFQVVFEGGVYTDKIVKVYPLETALEIETEIVEEV